MQQTDPYDAYCMFDGSTCHVFSQGTSIDASLQVTLHAATAVLLLLLLLSPKLGQ